MHIFCLGCKFFLDFWTSRFSFVIFLVWFSFFSFMAFLLLLFEIIPVIKSVGAFFLLRFLFHCRYSKCICSSMKWSFRFPWHNLRRFFFFDSNAFRRNIMSTDSLKMNHSINNRKKWLGKVSSSLSSSFVILFLWWHTLLKAFFSTFTKPVSW